MKIIALIIFFCATGAFLFLFKKSYDKQENNSSPMLLIECKQDKILQELQQEIASIAPDLIEKIIQSSGITELDQNSKDIITHFFQIKPRLWMTLFYVGTCSEENETLLVSLMTNMHKQKLLHLQEPRLEISTEIAFFGKNKDELVLLVKDNGQLADLHKNIKNFLLSETKKLSLHEKRDIFDTKNWELFPFVPHVSLGRLRLHELMTALGKNNPALDSDQVQSMIREKFIAALSPIVKERAKNIFFMGNFLEIYGKERKSIASLSLLS